MQPPDERLEDPKWKNETRRVDGAPRSFPLLLPKQPTEQSRFQLTNRLLRLSHGYRDLAMLCLQERSGCKDCCDASGPQFLEVDLAQWLNSLPIKFFVPPKEAINITLYRGWSWVEWGGVGLARLQFWLQKADFGHFGKDGVLVTS